MTTSPSPYSGLAWSARRPCVAARRRRPDNIEALWGRQNMKCPSAVETAWACGGVGDINRTAVTGWGNPVGQPGAARHGCDERGYPNGYPFGIGLRPGFARRLYTCPGIGAGRKSDDSRRDSQSRHLSGQHAIAAAGAAAISAAATAKPADAAASGPE